MTINGIEFDIDFTDAEFLEKIEEGSKKVYEEAEKIKAENEDKKSTLSEGIRQECKIIKDFLDYVLGEGASEKIFKNKNSLNECLKVFEDIINTRNNQYNDFMTKFSKYSPERFKR